MYASRQRNNVSRGRVGERVIIKTTTSSGEGLRYTLTRPLRATTPEPPGNASGTNGTTAKCIDCSEQPNRIFITAKPPAQPLSSASTVLVRSSSTGCYAHMLGDHTGVGKFSIKSKNTAERSNSNCEISTRHAASVLTCAADVPSSNQSDQAKKFRQRKLSELSLKSLQEQSAKYPVRSPPLSATPLCSEVAAFFASDSIHCSSNDAVKRCVHVTADEKNPCVVTSSAVACTDATVAPHANARLELEFELEPQSPAILRSSPNDRTFFFCVCVCL
ncbi:hypothetical protein Tcan_05112 [Toxocara canis]|uniref:Uncharacterized protein n=1 Tax=Toxocara canis TaxID=6265 RepID=A0A0B2VPC5_TOXCA|nr:hypothetical protein Tcan_05112 [Toxocara canis]